MPPEPRDFSTPLCPFRTIRYLRGRKSEAAPPLSLNPLMSKHIGKVVQVIGPVVDVRFEGASSLPNIYDALQITRADGTILVLETQQLPAMWSCMAWASPSACPWAMPSKAVCSM